MASQTHQLKKEITSFIDQNEGVLKRKGEKLLKKLDKKLQRIEKERDPIFKKRSLASKKGWDTRKRKLPQSAYIVRTAHHGRARDYVIKNYIAITPDKFFQQSQSEVSKVLKDHIPNKTSFKLQCVFENVNRPERGEIEQYISTSAMTILTENSMENVYERAIQEILQKIIDFTNEESGWRLKEITAFHLYVSDYSPIGGSSYKDLPKYFRDKKCLVNVKNDDNECGKWAITIALNMPQKNKNRVTTETRENSKKYNWDDITFPMTVEGLEIFERNNKDIALIVYVSTGREKKEIAPLYLSKRLDITPKEKIAILFVYSDHYCVVSNENALLLKEGQDKKCVVCRRCISTFATCGKSTAEEKLEKHSKLCQNFDYAKTKFPKEGNHILKFKNYRATLKHPIMITFDFESLLEQCDPGEMENTRQISKHIPVSFGLYVNRFDGKNEYFDHIGLDAVKIFVDKLEAIVKDFYKEFKDSKPMEDLEIANEALQRETICWFCKEDLNDDRVRDHDPYTSKFRGIAHSKCNLNAKKSFFIPIIAHNLNYDEGLFFRDLVNKFGFTKIIPKNTENFISFSKFFKVDTKMKDDKEKGIYVELRFLDSYRFMGLSLEKLIDCVRKEDLKSLKEEFKDNFDLVCKKGLIPYSYLTCMDRLRERNFPPLEEFLKNDLQYKNPKREDYDQEETFLRSKRVWDEYVETVKEKYNNTKETWIRFKCKRVDDLLRIYQKMDVLQLNDVFSIFRDEMLDNFGLEPLRFYTTPSLSWEALFKESKVEVELFTENQKEMSLDIESCIRGGISNAPTRYSEANNKYLEDYDSTKESKFIMSNDKNSLYAGVMTKYPLPYGGYENMEKEELENWEKVCSEEGKGCWIWVDLEYPPELHDDHNELPLAPEKINGKLVPNLSDKKNYGSHYIVLQHYLKWGLKITKIYRGIKFNDSFWMKPYVEKNIELRKEAKKEKNEFNEMLYKLLPNSGYGKSIQNDRNKADIEVCQGWNFDKLVKRVNFKDRTILDYNKSLAHFRQTTVKMNKPKIVGASILDLSKIELYSEYYDYSKSKFGDRVKVLYTDTDSLKEEYRVEDYFEETKDDVEERFDTSKMDKNHLATKVGYPVGRNQGVTLLMKNENPNKQIRKFVALGPKLYAEDDNVKAKGISKVVTRQELGFEVLNQCRLTEEKVLRKMTILRKRNHEWFTEEITKVAVKAEDNKRYILEDKIHTLAPGHWRICGDFYIPLHIPYPRGDLGKLCLQILKK